MTKPFENYLITYLVPSASSYTNGKHWYMETDKLFSQDPEHQLYYEFSLRPMTTTAEWIDLEMITENKFDFIFLPFNIDNVDKFLCRVRMIVKSKSDGSDLFKSDWFYADPISIVKPVFDCKVDRFVKTLLSKLQKKK